MSTLFKVFDVSGSALSAQSIRLNTIASNMANAEVASNSAETAYRGRHPVFGAMIGSLDKPPTYANIRALNQDSATSFVKVLGIIERQAPPRMEYSPNHPLANEEGYIFRSNVNVVEEMADMISASRSYQNNVEVMNTTKQLLQRTLQMGQT